MRHRAIAIVSAVAVLVALVSSGAAPAVAQTASVRTAWGEPDLRGIWDFRTITPLERPAELADQAFLTEEEAATLEREVVERNARLLARAPERTEAADQVDRREDGTPGFYNNFWLDQGTTVVGTRRTSRIVDPPRRTTAAPDAGGGAARHVAGGNAGNPGGPGHRPPGFMGGPLAGVPVHPSRQSRSAHQPWWLQQ